MSVINQMLKDLEQRRAQGFDGQGGMLGDLAAGRSESGRDRGLKVILVLMIAVLVLLAWLLWERFSQPPAQLASAPAQSPVQEVQAPTLNKQPAVAAVETVSQTEMPVIETIPIAVVEEESTSAADEVVALKRPPQEDVKDSLLHASEVVARIDRIAPTELKATGKRTALRIYGEGFVHPFDVLLEWSGGRGFKVLDDWQVESVNENELILHFNPGTQADDWAVRIERQDGASSQRFSFTVSASASEARETTSPVQAKTELAVTPSKTRRQAPPGEQAAGLFARASGMLKNGQTAEAATLLREVLVHDAGHNGARELLASLLFHDQQHAEAAAVLTAGIVQQPGHIPFSLLLARVRMEQGRDTDAIAVLEGQKPLARDYNDYYALLAALYQRVSRHTDAAAVYRGLVAVFPGRAVWWMGLGISLQSLDQTAEALTAYQHALRARGLQPELKKFVQERIRLLGG
jgi:cytochrome c-type biogenesis protein CcmH/NrfG